MVYMPHWPKLLRIVINHDLNNIQQILELLNHPQKKIPPAIHVAGTNGKGSTIAFIYCILKFAGYKVHVYTSPHLIEFNERIILANKKISDSYLFEILEECRTTAEQHNIQLTFFEAATAAAFLAFSRIQADITLIETGMGGRLDATNVIEPIITIITSVSLDHTEFLGESVELIAAEKAGIIKHNVPCIVSPQQESVMKIIEHYAKLHEAPIYRGYDEWKTEKSEETMSFSSNNTSIKIPLPSLPGDHQLINAGNAIAACGILVNKFDFDIDHIDVSNGISKATWPARLELINSGAIFNRLPKTWKLFLDGAHNPGGAEILAKWATNLTTSLYVICGISRGKDSRKFLKYLKPFTHHLYGVCVKHESRGQTAQEITNAAHDVGINSTPCQSIIEAIEIMMKAELHRNEITILVCGSLFLAGDLMMDNY